MKTRLRASRLLALALAALFFATGCERVDSRPQTAEIDEPGFRRGKELARQGRANEAIIEFNKVLNKRGPDNSPETNLELGLLNERLDPFIAIFHLQKYRQLKPLSDRDDMVRMRIEVVKREYAGKLLGRSLPDSATAGADLAEQNKKLEAENNLLRNALREAGARVVDAAANAIFPAPPPAGNAPAPQAPATRPISNATPQQPAPPVGVTQPIHAQPPPQQPQQQTPPPRAQGRAYTVKRGDSLFSIARQIYGTASNAQVEAIVRANRDILTEGRDTPLREGMVLKLP